MKWLVNLAKCFVLNLDLIGPLNLKLIELRRIHA